MKFIAHVTKGLEQISKEEIIQNIHPTFITVRQKMILFDHIGDLLEFSNLKTVDDFGIVIGEFPVDKLLSLNLGKEMEYLNEQISIIRGFRKLGENYSITLDKYQNPALDKDLLSQNLTLYLDRHLGLKYTPIDHSNLDVRINITGKNSLLSVKLFPHSLYKREYGHISLPGAIRSTIAASVLYKLLGDNRKSKVVDLLCGSGTFLCEALSFGCKVAGNDIDPDSVKTTVENLNRVKKGKYTISNSNVSETNFKNDSFDIALSNFPWDKQIKVVDLEQLIDITIKEYSRILKPNSQVGFISTRPDLIKKYLDKYFRSANFTEYKIGYLGQVPWVVMGEVVKSF